MAATSQILHGNDSHRNSPGQSVALPLSLIGIGIVALVTALGWLVARPDLITEYHYNQWIIALTHLLVLGWVCSVVMGAMYQLVPVALETRLYSVRLAWVQVTLHVIGFVGMVWMFSTWNMKQVGHFGSALGLGVFIFGYNIVRTVLRAPKWNATAAAISAAVVWICLSVTAGLALATAKCTYASEAGTATVARMFNGLRAVAGFVSKFDAISAMHAHAHLGAVGFFTMLLVGVSYKLIPMFTLSQVQNPRRAMASVALLNCGLAGAFVTILLRSPGKILFAGTIAFALAVYGWEMRAILRARKRRALDWGIKYFLCALLLLAPVSLLGIVLSWPGLPLNRGSGQLENLYGFLGLIGVISFAIIGMLYKIIPFLVWFKRYSPHIGRAQLPALADLYSTSLQALGFWFYLGGLSVSSTGIVLSNTLLTRSGCILLGVGVVCFVTNICKILSHLFKPRLNLSVKTTPVDVKSYAHA